MIATQITTHVQDGLGRLLEQYKNKANIQGFYTAFLQHIQQLENALFSLDAGRQLWNGTTTPAVGAQLDLIGEIVGLPRSGMPDATYLLFIFGKIAENNSDTTIPTILSIIAYLFQATNVVVQETYPAAISMQVFGSALSPSLYSSAKQIVQQAIGAGIKLIFVGASSSTNVFRFFGPGVVGSINGFGDVSNPGIGGGFIGLI